MRAHDPSVGFDGGEPRRGFWTIRHVEADSSPEAGQEAIREVLAEGRWREVVDAEWGADPILEAREVDEVLDCDCHQRSKLGLAFFGLSVGQ